VCTRGKPCFTRATPAAIGITSTPARADIIMKTAHWDLHNGPYTESYSARDEVKASPGTAYVRAQAEGDSELKVK